MLAFRYEFPVESKVIVLFRVPLLGETERERERHREKERRVGRGGVGEKEEK